jgi:hypothetical protein
MRQLLIAASLLVLACGKKDGDDTDTDTDTDTDKEEEVIVPTDGTWNLSDSGMSDNTCGFEAPSDSDLPGVEIASASKDGFDLTFTPAAETAGKCTYTDTGFTCEEKSQELDLNSEGFAAVLTLSSIVSGALESEDKGSFSWRLDYTCEGAGCDDAATEFEVSFPCGATLAADMDHSG